MPKYITIYRQINNVNSVIDRYISCTVRQINILLGRQLGQCALDAVPSAMANPNTQSSTMVNPNAQQSAVVNQNREIYCLPDN